MIGVSLGLCDDTCVKGWVLDEQLGGFGLSFTKGDADALTAHETCCIGAPVTIQFTDDPEGRQLAVRLIHISPVDGNRGLLQVGVTLDNTRLGTEEVSYLFDIWQRLSA